MSRLVTVTAGIAGLLVAAACASPSRAGGQDAAADVAAINAVVAREIAAFTSFDYAEIHAIFAPDVVVMPPGEPAVSGHDALVTWTRAIAEQATATGEYTSSDVIVAGDWAVQRFTGRLTFTPKTGGPATTESVKGLHVLRRQADGTWQITQDVWNSDAPVAGTTAAATRPWQGV